MRKVLVFGIVAVLIILSIPQTPAITDSWIKIEEPAPGIYWHGDKILAIKNAVILIGMGNEIEVAAKGSENIISTYFALYDAREKNMTASQWDFNKNDGWECTFEVERGIYVLVAAGAAIDINEPVAIDYMVLVVW